MARITRIDIEDENDLKRVRNSIKKLNKFDKFCNFCQINVNNNVFLQEKFLTFFSFLFKIQNKLALLLQIQQIFNKYVYWNIERHLVLQRIKTKT